MLVPPPPVQPTQLPPMPQHVQPGQVQPISQPVQQAQVPPMGQPVQPATPQIHAAPGQVQLQVHGSGQPAPAAAVAVQTTGSVPGNVQQPANPVLQAALAQAMVQPSNVGTVTMDDVANLLITSGRASLHYRGANASQEYQRQFHRH